jgi:UDP-N-acetylglucosamine 2-epimerase (non-hydrolysing)
VASVIVVLGTRPEAIKMFPVVVELRQWARVSVLSTGQHDSLLEPILKYLKLEPDFRLKVMSPGQDLSSILEKVIKGVKKVVEQCKPNLMLVQGDTTSAMGAALVAAYAKVPLFHVEAGLRTESIAAPFPEEINRRIISKVAAHHFAPTSWAKDNLLREGVAPKTVTVCGNTVIDTLAQNIDRIRKIDFSHNLRVNVPWLTSHDENVIPLLVTVHRRENLGRGLLDICDGLKRVLANNNAVRILCPVHKNPIVEETLVRELSGVKRVHLLKPLNYVDFVKLMDRSKLILTDSGGVQEEAPFLGKPVLVLRDETERPEGVLAGTAKIVGSDSRKIAEAVETLLTNEVEYQKMAKTHNPYGSGDAAKTIAKKLFDLGFLAKPICHRPPED